MRTVPPDELDIIRAQVSERRNGESPEELDDASLVGQMRARILFGAEIDQIPPPEPLIPELLMRNSLALLYGASGGGKSFMALDWAASVATGTRFFGRRIEAQPVLYVAAEGVSGMAARRLAWALSRSVQDDAMSALAFLPYAVNLSDPLATLTLAEVASELDIGLLVVDTLARSTPTAEENSSKDMGQVIEHLDGIRRQTGACVLVVHHSGKDQERGARGHSSLRAAMDTELELKAANGTLMLKVTKQKDGPEVGPFRYRLVATGDSMAIENYSGGAARDNALLALGALARIHTGATSGGAWRESGEASGLAHTAFYEARKFCLDQGWVIETSPGSRYSPVTLTDQGKRLSESESGRVRSADPDSRSDPSEWESESGPPIRGRTPGLPGLKDDEPDPRGVLNYPSRNPHERGGAPLGNRTTADRLRRRRPPPPRRTPRDRPRTHRTSAATPPGSGDADTSAKLAEVSPPPSPCTHPPHINHATPSTEETPRGHHPPARRHRPPRRAPGRTPRPAPLPLRLPRTHRRDRRSWASP
jgi:hypothetical protein